ncbi:MAG: hypothetical protein KDA22_02575 [Phycisphaerales bacterium]|nr:hypothetical protein [Phycisphaerales bacterium]
MSALLVASVPVQNVANVCLVLMAVALCIGLLRLLRGPTLADRVVALDAMVVVAAAMIALFAIVTDDPMLIRVTLVIALVGFMSTVALASFISARGRS